MHFWSEISRRLSSNVGAQSYAPSPKPVLNTYIKVLLLGGNAKREQFLHVFEMLDGYLSQKFMKTQENALKYAIFLENS